MKKLLTFILAMFAFCTCVYALEHGDISVDKESLNKGETFTITVELKDVNKWNLNISAEGISDCNFDESGESPDGSNMSETITKTCTATTSGVVEVAARGTFTTAEDSTDTMIYLGLDLDVADVEGGSSMGNEEETPVPSGDETKNSADNPETGAPTVVYIIGGLVLILCVTLILLKKNRNSYRQI